MAPQTYQKVNQFLLEAEKEYSVKMETRKIFPGPYCEELGLTCSQLTDNAITLTSTSVRNGVIVELMFFANKSNLTQAKIAEWLCSLHPELKKCNVSTVKSRIKRVIEKYKKFGKRIRNGTHTSVKEFLDDVFSSSHINAVSANETHSMNDNNPTPTQSSVQKTVATNPLPQTNKSVLPTIPFTSIDTEPLLLHSVQDCESSEKKTSEQETVTLNSLPQINKHETKFCDQETVTLNPLPLINENEICEQETVTLTPSPQPQTTELLFHKSETPKQETVTQNSPPQINELISLRETKICDQETVTLNPLPQTNQIKSVPPSVCSDIIAHEGDVTAENYLPKRETLSAASDKTKCSEIKNKQRKSHNLIEYEILKKQKALKKRQNLMSSERDSLEKMKFIQGHYSIRNVNKRDAVAKKNRQQLREATRKVRHLQSVISGIQASELEKQTLRNREEDMKVELQRKQSVIDSLAADNKMLNEKIDEVKLRKVNAGKSVRYLKQTLNNLRKSSNSQDQIGSLKQKISEKDSQIQALEMNTEMLKEELSEKHSMKNSNGSLNNNMRLCVIELAGLEVAVEKISSVIEVVSKHIFSRNLSKSDLPGKTTVQAMIDEGHYLAKTFVSAKINESENFGVQRDGTSRKKQKLLDTSITLDNGEIISLGFTRVSKETAKTINDVTKKHMEELAELHQNYRLEVEGEVDMVETPSKKTYDDAVQPTTPKSSISDGFIYNSLQKLAFSMSDRASNEKLADKLLDDWRSEVLSHCDSDQKLPVLHFHCMAHVLLGFHRYACDDLKVFEKVFTTENGPVGRDALPQFKTWRKIGTLVERTTKTVSDSFGPAGDHLGVRDLWEAHCAQKGIKSIIGNYKDNRFNAIFQTSAEVFLHREDFIQVLQMVENPNLKLQAVAADLSSEHINILLQCFGLLYLKITGPYWNLVSSGTVPYLLLYTFIQDLAKCLESCSSDPSKLLDIKNAWNDETYNISQYQRLSSKLCIVSSETKDVLFKLISLTTKAMLRCVEKQLVDFLPGGKYSEKPSERDLNRTKYAHTTNLGCEHHFGDLDCSQRRRPNASMHHHSSVQILKRNRKSLQKWLEDMPSSQKINVMKSARKGGRDLRQAHVEVEKRVLTEIHETMMNEKNNPRKQKRKQNVDCEEFEEPFEAEDISKELPNITHFVDNEYVAVAYQDMWYPGCVIKSCEKEETVNFMAPTRNPGVYVWPLRKDVQSVKSDFVLKRGFIPECLNSGCQWAIPDYKKIDVLFEKFSNIYFKS